MSEARCQPFRLLDLPVEIRAMIFADLLVVDCTIHDHGFDKEGEEPKMCVHREVYLLRITPIVYHCQTTICEHRLRYHRHA